MILGGSRTVGFFEIRQKAKKWRIFEHLMFTLFTRRTSQRRGRNQLGVTLNIPTVPDDML
jgi:hypothetical protein